LTFFARKQSFWLVVAIAVVVLQAIGSLLFKEGYAATIVSDTVPLVFACVLIALCQQNSRLSAGSTRMFWVLNTAAFVFLLLSHSYWFFYEVVRRVPAPTPLFADGSFFLMPALMLAALAFRPHSESAARDLRFRRLDFAFLLSWWLCFYLYFAVPWLTVVHDFASYNPANYYLVLAEQSAVVLALLVLWRRTSGAWRRFYGHACLALVIYALANFLLGLAMSAGKYYSGSIYDLPVALGGLWMVYALTTAANLQPVPESPLADPGRQGLWAARLGMLAMISLPLLATYGYLEGTAPGSVIAFRLRLILCAMFFLGALCFLRLYGLDRELQWLVNATESSYESLKSVQERIAHAQKLAALGRLASGAAHEINNPLTAIFGYSGLLADNPSLSPEERRLAHEIQDQVRLAQAAVSSMRDSALRSPADSPDPSLDPLSR
jgi:signal transduction histidine kinase